MDDPRSLLMSPIIKSDEDRIKQVLLGLQSNALKFTDEEGQIIVSIKIQDQQIISSSSEFEYKFG